MTKNYPTKSKNTEVKSKGTGPHTKIIMTTKTNSKSIYILIDTNYLSSLIQIYRNTN